MLFAHCGDRRGVHLASCRDRRDYPLFLCRDRKDELLRFASVDTEEPFVPLWRKDFLFIYGRRGSSDTQAWRKGEPSAPNRRTLCLGEGEHRLQL